MSSEDSMKGRKDNDKDWEIFTHETEIYYINI
jgi:hypothetical protein